MEYLIILAFSVAGGICFLSVRDIMRQEKVAKLIAEELFKLEKENPTKFGFDYKYKIRNSRITIKFWQVRGRNAWEIYKTVRRDI